MKGFWMIVMVMVLGFVSTGCPEGDDDADAACVPACGPGYTCLYGDCVPEGGDADGGTDNEVGADADSDADTTDDTTETEDDATDEGTASCPSVAGNWNLTYVNEVVPGESHETLTLEQDGCLVIGTDDYCEWSGIISESGWISVFVDCSRYDRNVSGTFTPTPIRMSGNWDEPSRPDRGTWRADPQ